MSVWMAGFLPSPEATRRRRASRILRGDIVLKMFDGFFLFRNEPLHEITD